jgi:hypothetical protein
MVVTSGGSPSSFDQFQVSVAMSSPARRLLIFASAVTLALNVADPLVAGAYGKAAFDAVGPLLLLGWAEVGPDLLRALTITLQPNDATPDGVKRLDALLADELTAVRRTAPESQGWHGVTWRSGR